MLTAIVVVIMYLPRRKSGARPVGAGNDGGSSSQLHTAAEAPAWSTHATEAVFDDCFRLAFGVARFDYQIIGEHAAVLERVHASASVAVHQREYFPRRPMLLPRLLQTLNDTESASGTTPRTSHA